MSYQPPPPPSYGAPGGGYGMGGNVREHPDGTTVLVLGILSLVVCGLLGPFAWSKGNRAMAEINSNPGVNYTNRGSINAGRICGMIATILLIIGGVILVIALIAAAAAS